MESAIADKDGNLVFNLKDEIYTKSQFHHGEETTFVMFLWSYESTFNTLAINLQELAQNVTMNIE